MAKEAEKDIIDEIQSILATTHTATELAGQYLNNRPASGKETGDRDEIIGELSGIEALRGKHDLLNDVADAYLHFSAQILFEGGYFSNRRIDDLLLPPDGIGGRLDDSMTAFDIVNSAPVALNAKSVLTARNNLLYLSREPVYLESSQLTGLQMLCLRVPEAIDQVIRVLGQRPFIRAEKDGEKPYLQAFARVLHALLEIACPPARESGRASGPDPKELTASILTAFYHEYLAFPSDDYLIDLVNRSV